jgi:hypothetical protein
MVRNQFHHFIVFSSLLNPIQKHDSQCRSFWARDSVRVWGIVGTFGRSRNTHNELRLGNQTKMTVQNWILSGFNTTGVQHSVSRSRRKAAEIIGTLPKTQLQLQENHYHHCHRCTLQGPSSGIRSQRTRIAISFFQILGSGHMILSIFYCSQRMGGPWLYLKPHGGTTMWERSGQSKMWNGKFRHSVWSHNSHMDSKEISTGSSSDYPGRTHTTSPACTF